MNCPAMPSGRGRGMKFRKPFRPKTRKITPARYRAIAEAVFITGFSFSIGSHSMASIILISIQLMVYTSRRFRFFMARGFQGTDHVWLVMMKAMRALTRYAAAGIEETGLGLSDFGVLEVLLHKGPLPVNTIGPIVALTPRGKELIASAFRKHSAQMKRVFSELSLDELRGLEAALKKVGKRAATLMEES